MCEKTGLFPASRPSGAPGVCAPTIGTFKAKGISTLHRLRQPVQVIHHGCSILKHFNACAVQILMKLRPRAGHATDLFDSTFARPKPPSLAVASGRWRRQAVPVIWVTLLYDAIEAIELLSPEQSPGWLGSVLGSMSVLRPSSRRTNRGRRCCRPCFGRCPQTIMSLDFPHVRRRLRPSTQSCQK